MDCSASVISDYHGQDSTPGPDQLQEYYEICSSKSHIFEPNPLRDFASDPDGNGCAESTRRGPASEISTMEYSSPRTDGWDAFKLQTVEVPTRCDKIFFDAFLQISKVIAYCLTFLLILIAGVISKFCVLLLTTNLQSADDKANCYSKPTNRTGTTVPTVTGSADKGERYLAVVWSICFCLLLPEIITWISCFRKVMLRQIQGPRSAVTWILAFITETLYVFGLLLFLYDVTTHTDILSALMLTSAFCFFPSLLALLTRHGSESFFCVRVIVDLVVLLFQITSLIFWPLIAPVTFRWTLPVALILISIRWWENYVSPDSAFRLIRWLSEHRTNIGQAQCKVYVFLSLWKILLILAWIAAWHSIAGAASSVNVFDLRNVFTGTSTLDLGGKVVNGTWVERRQRIWFWKPNAVFLLVAVVGSMAAVLGNVCGKYACRIRIHLFSFAIPVCLISPVTVSLTASVCETVRNNGCVMSGILPEMLQVKCPEYGSFWAMLDTQYAWLWFLWLLSQWYITMHIWKPMPERRKINHLFALPEFGSFPLDISSSLNRMRVWTESLHPSHLPTRLETTQSHGPRSREKKKHNVAHLCICSFFDRQTETDVVETIKSILRVDEEQCARRNALRFLIESDPDYFEFESHMFFEKAFVMDSLRGDRTLDKQLARLITTFQEAAANVHEFPVTLRPPRKVTTPYGGQLQWVLPGGNRCTIHFKDTNLIRAGERWSEVMALYYVLGHKIMQTPADTNKKEQFADSSYVLFTSGTVRFKPHAVTKLLDILKQGNHIGAATCRIRPVGTGPLVWYQMFEYAMRYWMDRSTEHMLGSLLRIRTGFTMFRAAALMDDNVIKKFAMIPDDSKEFIQFRLGNEQWLCSLLLKQGYKVEYCAAVDIAIHVPETYSDYLRESQRGFPLDLAATADITSNYSAILERNENITIMYVGYLMMALVSTIFAPGTVMLVIVTSLVNLFQLNIFLALLCNVGPVLVLMVVCVFGSPRLQDLVIKILSAAYGLIMLAVLISAAVQLHKSWLSASPVSIFMIAFILSTLLPAIFHPQEMWNIVFAPVYFIAIPTTYLLTVIHALCTFHLGNAPRKSASDEEDDLVQQIEKWEQLAKEAQNDPTKQVPAKIPSVDVIEQLKKYLPNGKKTVSFACGQFCGIVCCPPPDESPLEGPFGDIIGRELFMLGRKLQTIEHRLRARRLGLPGFRPRVLPPDGLTVPINLPSQQDMDQISEASANFSVSTVRTAVKSAEEFYEKFGGRTLNNDKLTEWLMSLTDPTGPVILENDHWMDDENLSSAEPDVLDPIEQGFWRELISTYLVPLAGSSAGLEEAMVEQMKKLRNKVGLGFLMVNSLFILMVFLLELRREDLFILLPSPFASSQKRTAIQIEPTGIAFLLFFFALMLVQFIAMLMHRWGTFSHLLASTSLTCCSGKKRIGFEYLRDNAVQIARELQSLKNTRDFEGDHHVISMDPRRKGTVSTLDVVFRKRFAAIQKTSGAAAEPGTAVTTLRGAPSTTRINHRFSKRTLDSKRGSFRETGERPHVIQVFQIARNDPMPEGDTASTAQSTTSF
ncbi:chitin synthase chs-2-like [Paramacrobiotus metropolitanus]|uniref:chitin synthase chs-2-like n=1 Tax=Paramacrobiotus metropolitanus TaxID=2943436 RepID=UPI002445DC4C|nr:chitin synthase chs-2-like [Paramacrobiotus metropolitanus]XP_055338626.1 chitin synthase chs-2-like [Paramacrobiotus metropolitanus]